MDQKQPIIEQTNRDIKFESYQANLHIVLDSIRSVFNVGSIFRSADATGSAKLYLCGFTADIDNPKIKKTALGATVSVPSKHFPDPQEAINSLQSQKIPIYSLELTEDAQHFQKINYPHPIAIVLGHERLGVSQPFLDASQGKIFIPMHGIKESLNVANAASIVMYEAMRNLI